MRRIPILTFINKLDLQESDALSLLDEIERVLEIAAVPVNWPIGSGAAFQGVYNLAQRQVLLFERSTHGQHRAPAQAAALSDPQLGELLGARAWQRLRDEIDLVTGVGAAFDPASFRTGSITPVFFGSALNNFGVEPFLDALVELAPAPSARASDQGPIEPTAAAFSGFIFKIQANMDPLHRDRMAFLRICSGRFEKDMQVQHPRLGRTVRMTRPHRLFARERETVEEAFPGDVIGLTNPGLFAIGDTLCASGSFQFAPIPRFPAERFGRLVTQDFAKHKQFHKGLIQLEEEGVIQVLFAADQARREPILAAVGDLQFDVVETRLRSEYGVETRIERLPHTCARWVDAPPAALASMRWAPQTLRTTDRGGQLVALFMSDWELQYSRRENPDAIFREVG